MPDNTEDEILQTWNAFQFGLRVAQAAWGTPHDFQQHLSAYPIVSQVARGELTLSNSPSDRPAGDTDKNEAQRIFHFGINSDRNIATTIQQYVARMQDQ